MEDIRIEIEEEREIRKGGEMLGHHRKFWWGDGRRGESFSLLPKERSRFLRYPMGRPRITLSNFVNRRTLPASAYLRAKKGRMIFFFGHRVKKWPQKSSGVKGVVSQRIMAPILVSLATGWTEKYKNL